MPSITNPNLFDLGRSQSLGRDLAQARAEGCGPALVPPTVSGEEEGRAMSQQGGWYRASDGQDYWSASPPVVGWALGPDGRWSAPPPAPPREKPKSELWKIPVIFFGVFLVAGVVIGLVYLFNPKAFDAPATTTLPTSAAPPPTAPPPTAPTATLAPDQQWYRDQWNIDRVKAMDRDVNALAKAVRAGSAFDVGRYQVDLSVSSTPLATEAGVPTTVRAVALAAQELVSQADNAVVTGDSETYNLAIGAYNIGYTKVLDEAFKANAGG